MDKDELLVELAACWRGDWSDFDGRTLRDQIDDWVKLGGGKKAFASFRKRWGMCPHGGGYWEMYCADYEKSPEALSNEAEV